jgi:hypothetical protein
MLQGSLFILSKKVINQVKKKVTKPSFYKPSFPRKKKDLLLTKSARSKKKLLKFTRTHNKGG